MVETYITIDGWQWHYDDVSPSTLTGVVQDGGSTEINIPAELVAGVPLTKVGDECFYNAEGKKITKVLSIPDSVTSIGSGAFSGCDSLTSITIPDSVTSIGSGAFSDCSSLTSITIPDSVTSISDYAFYGCFSLTSIDVNPNNPNYASIDGVLYSKDITILIQCPGGKSGDITIPESVTSIGYWAFSFCYSLTSIIIHDSVTSIGSGAFSYCSSLTSITIPDSVTSISDYAFSGCDSLTSITIPDSVTSIGSGAFSDCSSLTSITIPESVTSIGSGAFSSCAKIQDITFLGLTAPTVGINWIYGVPSSCLGHTYEASNFPAPGQVWNGLTMGEYHVQPEEGANEWMYRSSIAINAASGAGTGYQVLFHLYAGSGANGVETYQGIPATKLYLNNHAKADWGDIRFTAADGVTSLPYWVESSTTTEAVVWVKLSANINTAGTTVFCYYGNAAASSQSNGANVFEWFSHFDAGSPSDLFTGATSSASITSSTLRVTSSSGWASLLTKTSFSPGTSIRSMVKYSGGSHPGNEHQIGFGNAVGSERIADYPNVNTGFNQASLQKAIGNVYTRSPFGSTVGTIWTDNHIKEIRWLPNRGMFLLDGVTRVDWSTAMPSATMPAILNFNQGYGTAIYDWISVRKCIATEPMHGTPGSEECVVPLNPPIAQFTADSIAGLAPLIVNFTNTSSGDEPMTWLWDFGDGTTSTEHSPSHTYVAVGTYTVSLTATNTSDSNTSIKTDYITIHPDPVASFTVDTTLGTAPLTVKFSDTSSSDVISWLWDFGDGVTSTEQNPIHTYTNSGLFTVTLTASNQFGSDTMTKPEYIEAIDPAWIPTAAFTASETEGVVPFVVTFNDTTTGKAPLDYSWTFGDGSSSTEQHPVHVYDAPGVYTVSLTVSNQYGNSSTTGSITVYLKPKADFIISSYSGEVPLTVQFTDKSINATTWHWDFGDGVTSEEQHPTHVYWTVGEYIVSLTISSIWGSDVRRAKESIVVGDFYKDIFIESHMGMNHRRSEVSDIKPITANENEATRLVVTFPKEMHGFEKHVIISYINSTGKKATTSILMDYSDKLEAYVFVLSNEYLYGKEVRIQFQCVPTDNKNIQTFMDPQILRFIIKESLRGKPPQTSS